MRISDWSSDVCSSDLSSGSFSAFTSLPEALASAAASFTWSHAGTTPPCAASMRRRRSPLASWSRYQNCASSLQCTDSLACSTRGLSLLDRNFSALAYAPSGTTGLSEDYRVGQQRGLQCYYRWA